MIHIQFVQKYKLTTSIETNNIININKNYDNMNTNTYNEWMLI